MPRTARLLAPVTLAAALLAGCTSTTPMPTPPPSPDATPVFASDEEALAAAEEAYGKYLAVVDAILSDGGRDPERLLDVVSDEVYERELEGFKTYESKGWRQIGTRTFSLTLQRYDSGSVVVYSCDDVSATDVVDSSGTSIVSPDRQETYAFEVEFLHETTLILDRKELWDGGAVCV